jgi:hypothetical protein
VKPIYKNGTKEDANNYCPITLVQAPSKILEKAIANRLISFLDKHPILNKSQFRFRKNKSTKDVTATIMENTTENLNIENAIVYYYTYQKHLNVLNITLMDKLYQYGVCGIPYKLI